MRKLYRLSDLPVRDVPFRDLPQVRGHMDELHPSAQGVRVKGWMALPGEPIDQIEVHHAGRHVFTCPMVARPDVKQAFPWLPYAESVGFDFELPLTPDQTHDTTRLDLVCRHSGAAAPVGAVVPPPPSACAVVPTSPSACAVVPTSPSAVSAPSIGKRGRMSQLVRRDVDDFPSAPIANMYRVAHQKDAHNFKVGGLKSFGDFLEPLARHGDLSRLRRMLDWGCGCGRMGMYFLAAADGPEYSGCDIDADAIAWAQAHLPGGTFSVLDPMPPAPYADGHFDLITSFSVFTHLTRQVQHAWLAEMRRLLAPGGLFLATTHGAMAYQFANGNLAAAFPPEGIVDSHKDPTLDGIAPKGYYRGTFQSPEYTRREFGKYFSVLDYLEAGATNHQDIVVLRKP